MKGFLNSKIFIGILSFVLGGAALYGAEKYMHGSKVEISKSTETSRPEPSPKLSQNMDSLFDQFYDDEFFNRSRDPFKEMKKMREHMLKNFDSLDDPFGSSSLFDTWYKKKFGGGDAGELNQREDDKYVYYEITLQDPEKENLNVKVENGQITISNRSEAKSEDANSHSYSSSSYYRSFPVPHHVDEKKVEMKQEGNKLVVKFPKTQE